MRTKNLFAFLLTVGLMFVPTTAASAANFKNCAQLNLKYRNGVALNAAKAKKQKVKPLVNSSLYKNYIKLDKDRDGTVCERSVSLPIVVVVSTTTPPPNPVNTTVAPAPNATVALPATTTTTVVPGSFSAGKKAVGGGGVTPGRYVTLTATSCYWERLRDFSGSLSGIIANDNSSGSHIIVDIAPTDVGFNSSRCGTWFPFVANPPTSFGDGVWSIGDEMPAGTWSATFTTSCYWARLSGFGGTLDEIIANDNETSSAIVQIQSGDAGFLTSRCGTWTRVG